MRLSRPLSLAAAAAVVVGAVVAPVAAGASTPSAKTVMHQVPGVLSGLSKATKLGTAPSSRVLDVAIGVQAPDTAGEKALYASMYDPKSANYHHFMTPAQFDAAFGVKQATRDAITSWLAADGLKITSVSDDGLLVEASGTVAQLDKRFAVKIGSYTEKDTGAFVANDVAPTVPANLPITVVSGLDTVQHVSTAVDQSKTYPQKLTSAVATGSFNGVLTPENLWSVYDEPSTDEGQGQTIGIFGEGTTDPVITQLRLFEHRFDLPKIPVQTVYTQPGVKGDENTTQGTGGDNGGNVEWYLDAQSSTGMAPKAKELQLWFSNTLFDPDIAESISKWTAAPACTTATAISTSINPVCAPMQMNASFGECEAGAGNDALIPLSQLPYGTELGDELEPLADPMLLKATMMGRTLFSSAGDTGDGCPEVALPVVGAANGLADQPIPIVNYPCASAYAVCVGGTVLTTDGGADADESTTSTHNTRVDEISWETSGGGPSHYIQEPKYQDSIANINITTAPCPADYDGTPYTDAGTVPCRMTPDVAALSGNSFGNGYFIYIDGAPSSEGGTSLASPLTMGMWARLQAASASATGNGFANETYYAHYGTDDSEGNYFDVTCIEEDLMGGDPVCSATGESLTNGVNINRDAKGYDGVSGLGVPDIGKLLMAVDGTKTARLAETPQEAGQYVTPTVVLSSPYPNAQDPAANNPIRGIPAAGGVTGSLVEESAADLTEATLTTSTDGKTVTATMTGPELSSTPDTTSASGENFVIYWYEPGKKDVYYLEAATSATGAPTYTAGDAATGFTAISAATVTGSFTGNTLKMSAPLAALGAPAKGTLLEDPSANTQTLAGALDLVTDTAAYLSPAVSSRGQAVCVGGCAATPVTVTTPTTPTTPTKTTTTTTGELAFTGLSVVVPIVALVLVAAGAGTLVVRRRRGSEI